MKIIAFVLEVEVPDDEDQNSLERMLAILEDELGKRNYNIYDTRLEEV